MTQLALSRSLRWLVHTLGARLFERHSGGMVLTQFGAALERHAEMLEFETSRVVEEIRMLNGAASGFVCVGVAPSVVSTLLLPTIAAVNAAAPSIQVQVIEVAGDKMRNSVATNRVDLAIIGQIQTDSEHGVIVSRLGGEEVCVAARPYNPIFSLPKVSVADLARYRRVLLEKEATRSGSVSTTSFAVTVSPQPCQRWRRIRFIR